MDEEQVTKDILDAKVQLEVPDTYAVSLTNPLSYFRFRIVPNLELNGFDRSLGSLQIHPECDHFIECALSTNDFEMFEQILWLIKDENNLYTRRALIKKYIRVCCCVTDDAVNNSVDHLLTYLHQNFENTWQFDIGLLFDLLHDAGANVEKLITLLEDVKITEILNDVQLKSKLNYDDQTISKASTNQILNSIKRVFRIVLSLAFFQVERLNSTLSNDNHLFLFLLGFYLQLDKRFQDLDIIHLARRLMVNGLSSLTSTYWNEKRDLLVECLYTLSSKNIYIIELFLKTNERTVRVRTQLGLLHLKRLVNMIEHERKSEATIIGEIIADKLNPRLFERQTDFIDCVRLLGDIIDSYPHSQQIDYLAKLYDKIHPYSRAGHEKLFTHEQHLILFDDCQRWATMLRSCPNENDFQKHLKPK
ncbi:unnamed protein product [Rotaria socialis]|uniref:Uncharacterized protein n=1 Tax=Rotaria socialis TaxID=392032 RepID=A0A818M6W3_9BILA|nr:unnamed protein product [Rotaria socialis]CAF3429868.1 unnamed protein product [Rotaria socialis]CAF3586118.1 unnamed protein product [Rotaria socialis]CAF3750770.1 unnamed protein product [Rotaria socialis]CAF4155145.1 unnamed protein product [Rotaria socialis]